MDFGSQGFATLLCQFSHHAWYLPPQMSATQTCLMTITSIIHSFNRIKTVESWIFDSIEKIQKKTEGVSSFYRDQNIKVKKEKNSTNHQRYKLEQTSHLANDTLNDIIREVHARFSQRCHHHLFYLQVFTILQNPSLWKTTFPLANYNIIKANIKI